MLMNLRTRASNFAFLNQNQSSMKVVIPPVLFVLCTLLIVASKFLSPGHVVLSPPFSYMGFILIIMGLVVAIRIKKLFDKVDTEIHTFKIPRQLVKDGLFRFSRNPIYLGFTTSLVGIWLLIGNFIGLTGVIVFFLISNFWYIPYEEKAMEKEFGDEYRLYKSKVRRWI